MQRAWVIIVVLLVLIGLIYFPYKWRQLREEMKELKYSQVGGIIKSYKDLGHGGYYVWIDVEGGVQRYFFPNFKQYISMVEVGDSISKPQNSMTCDLYKHLNGGFHKYGTLEIGY